MRDVTKSVLSFSWSMSLLGLQQLGGALARRDCDRPAESLDTVTRAMGDQLGGVLKDTFKAGDKFQRGMVDLMFGMLGRTGARPSGAAGETPWQSGCGSCGGDARPGPDAWDQSQPDDFTTEANR